MRPAIDLGDGQHVALVRTHYGDEGAWRALLDAVEAEYAKLDEPPSRILVVDDPAWAGAAPDEAVAAVGDGEAEAVFLADERAMSEEGRPLLFAYVPDDEPRPDEETRFRVALDMLPSVDVNLSVANTDVSDYADAAREAPDGVLREASYLA
ncbi:DUF6924 domain-containing protein [Nocardiopsis trehalosi]|jgi:hypothetical protein|uniref:DUF6924 domain-containing protein n=1 Tax=Nocardiopsis trehalosi TaxID=109329 RepID=UPI00082EA411|nr:hypothetical protein [Nocardiopsis trehalosi]